MSSIESVILFAIENSPMRITQIHKRTGFTKASLSKAATSLEKKNLITRTPAGLKITHAGKTMIQKMLTPGMRRTNARPFVLRRNDSCLYFYDCCCVAAEFNWPAWGCIGCPINESNGPNNRGQ